MTSQISSPDPVRPQLETVTFKSLSGFEEDDHLAAWQAFSRTCRSIARQSTVLRPAVLPDRALLTLARSLEGQAEPRSPSAARELFERYFQPFEIVGAGGDDPAENGFLTGYYEPLVEGSLVCTPEFTELELLRRRNAFSLSPDISAAQRRPDGRLEPYPDRAAIEAGAVAGHTKPAVWLRDGVEVFMVQVQGSARVRLPDGRLLRLTYAGRNGRPYSSIGRSSSRRGIFPPPKCRWPI